LERNEASVGINRKAQIRGVQREDENIFGCVHLSRYELVKPNL